MAGELESMDIINPPIKRINFGGEVVEIAFIPMRVSLGALKINDDIKKGKLSEYDGFEKLVEITVHICEKSNPNINRDWLLDNASIDMLMKFFEFAGGAGKGVNDVTPGKPGKN